ncbi:MAG TPA: beta/gamma crystallin-related protein [Burkholderiaceae bacterium]|nr:beta/gamma crystallin-related protein [Burkholderiaceae bacterium]
MNAVLKRLLALCVATFALNAWADVTFYEHDNFNGRSFSARDAAPDFRRIGFNDRASSVVVRGEPWEVCEHVEFGGQCFILRPGNYPSLQAMNMNDRLSSARPLERDRHPDEGRYAPRPMPGQITFFEYEGFQGGAFSTDRDVPNFRQFGFNNRASSVMVLGERWEACEHSDFGGRCVILRPGRYPDLGSMGLNNQLSSVRLLHPAARFDEGRYAPQPVPVYDWRRRPEERIYEVPVAAVHAVYAAPSQRCWIEREQVVQQRRGDPNVGGAVIGGIVGGILGHQVGGGSGRDVATVGGAVAGAVIGANVGRDRDIATTQDVQRCAAVPPQERPEYWDVAYRFRGVEHHVQMTAPPGPTVAVNENGEPRL